MHKIFQAYYDEVSKHYLDTEAATPLDVSFNRHNPLADYNVYKTLLANGTLDPDKGPVGIISWKFKAKTKIEISEFSSVCEQAFQHGVDVVCINPLIGAEALYKNVWEHGEHKFKNMDAISRAIFTEDQMKQMEFMPKAKFALCNYFVGNKNFWVRYMEFCDSVLQAIETFKETNPLLYPLIYRTMHQDWHKKTDYRSHILERLFSSFIMLSPDIRIAHCSQDATVYERKFDKTLGQYLQALSEIKNKGIESDNAEILHTWKERRRTLTKNMVETQILPADDPAIAWTVNKKDMSLYIKEIHPGFRQLLDGDNLEDLFLYVNSLSDALVLHPILRGTALFMPELDDLMYDASLKIVKKPVGPPQAYVIVHVFTEVAQTGGHTRTFEDMVKFLPEYKHILILTDFRKQFYIGAQTLGILEERFKSLKIELMFLEVGNYLQKTEQLANYLSELAPGAIFIHGHPQDPILNAGISGNSAPRVIYVHHNDHTPSLGSARKDYLHVDHSVANYKLCKPIHEHSQYALSLTVEDNGVMESPAYPGALIGATCASPHKYEGRSDFSYAELLSVLFICGVEKMYHIGKMSESQQKAIRDEISQAGQDPTKIEFLPNTPSLALKLKELAPNFYLNSHPIGGGKATVEAMSVGLPVLFPRPSNKPDLLNGDICFCDDVIIKALDEIPEACRKLRTEAEQLGKRNRKTYESYYSAKAFRETLLKMVG